MPAAAELKAIEKCVRYAFMPNRLHLCGPEKQADLLEFYSKINSKKKFSLDHLKSLISEFETLFPYLKLIGRANQKNPFQEQIIEAYWVGDPALKKVGSSAFFDHLKYDIKLKSRMGTAKFSKFAENFDKNYLPHHNFHVFGVYRRTGKTETSHTLQTMDACRISVGKIKKVLPGKLVVKTKPLVSLPNGKIKEGEMIEKEILNSAENEILLSDVNVNDYVSIHWGCACEKLDQAQVESINRITQLSLKFAALE